MTKVQQYSVALIVLVVAIAIGVAQNGSRSYSQTASSVGYGGQLAVESFDEAAYATSDVLNIRGKAYPIDPPTAGEITVEDQRIIMTGYITLDVNDITESLAGISSVAAKHQGFVQNSNAGENGDGSRYGYVTIRVPVEVYNEALIDVRALGVRVTSESTNAEDITEQFTDLEARLKVAREEEQAYLALLGRSGSVSDLLQVQRELSQVRTRIEQLEGQMQYLENRSELSTITVTLEETASVRVPTKPFQPGEAIKDALQSVVVAFQFLVTALIWVAILGVGVALPIGVIAWIIYRVWKHRTHRV
ncbi:MAG: DUF4349 domain-containing protein [Patescibacteria group bacterium]